MIAYVKFVVLTPTEQLVLAAPEKFKGFRVMYIDDERLLNKKMRIAKYYKAARYREILALTKGAAPILDFRDIKYIEDFFDTGLSYAAARSKNVEAIQNVVFLLALKDKKTRAFSDFYLAAQEVDIFSSLRAAAIVRAMQSNPTDEKAVALVYKTEFQQTAKAVLAANPLVDAGLSNRATSSQD